MTGKQSAALYELAKRLHPEGVAGMAFIPVTVAGNPMELRYFTHCGDGTDIEFRFFRADARYSRRSFIVWSDGRAKPDDEGTIPEFDRKPGEKPITLSVDELIELTYEALHATL